MCQQGSVIVVNSWVPANYLSTCQNCSHLSNAILNMKSLNYRAPHHVPMVNHHIHVVNILRPWNWLNTKYSPLTPYKLSDNHFLNPHLMLSCLHLNDPSAAQEHVHAGGEELIQVKVWGTLNTS